MFSECLKNALIALFVLSCIAGCSDSKPQRSENTTNNPNLSQDLVNSWGDQKDFFIREDFQIVKWETAKSELLKKKYRGGKQYHTGWLTIYMKDGRKYLTKQPQLDVFYDFMEKSNLSTKGFGTE